MAITINKQPAAVCFAKNQQIVKLTSNLFVETDSAKGAFIFNATASYTNGTFAAFRFWGTLIIFTHKTSPTLNGFEIPLTGTATNAANYFKANYDIVTNFDVTTSGTNVIFTAKKKGLDSTALSNDDAVELNPPFGAKFVYTPGVNLKFRDNFKLFIEVHSAISTTEYENIYSAEFLPKQTTSTSGSVELNIEEILRSRIGYDADDYRNEFAWASKVIRDFYLTFTERYGSTAINHKYYTSSVFKALLGGVSTKIYPYTRFYALLNLKGRDFWLDLMHGRNMISDNYIPHTLFFLTEGVVAIGVPIFVYVKIYWDDSTTYITALYHAGARATGNDVLILPCGLANSALGGIISAVTTKKPLKYVVYINSIALSQRTFIIDTKYYSSVKYFRYVNSLGGLTTFRTTGEYEYGAEISFEEFDRELSNAYNSLTANESTIYNSMFTETFEVFSGFVGKYDVFLFLDFLLSEKKHEQLIDNGAPENYNYNNDLVEIKVDVGSVKLYKSKDGLFSYSFKYRYMNKSRALSTNDAIPVVLEGEDPVGGGDAE